MIIEKVYLSVKGTKANIKLLYRGSAKFSILFWRKAPQISEQKLVMFSLQKGTHSCKNTHLQQLGFSVNLCPATKGSEGHPAFLCCRLPGNFSHFPTLVSRMKILGQRFGWPPEPNVLGFCRSNNLSLPLPDVGALVLCHKRQYLQHNIAEGKFPVNPYLSL
ncbi:hypothetical protein AAA081_06790 [Aedoeadaptatus acetigenes]|uniref:Uncharacterized protein n=1 Tax=Aedoeadaptatus acetigenes TaxID=2981723 RepID=A0ABV1J941_9FIRM